MTCSYGYTTIIRRTGSQLGTTARTKRRREKGAEDLVIRARHSESFWRDLDPFRWPCHQNRDSQHAVADPWYVENLQTFFRKCNDGAWESENGVPANGELSLDSAATTRAPSEAQTPRERLVYYDDRLIVRGVYGTVHRVMRARDGKYVAAKTSMRPTKRRLAFPPLQCFTRVPLKNQARSGRYV